MEQHNLNNAVAHVWNPTFSGDKDQPMIVRVIRGWRTSPSFNKLWTTPGFARLRRRVRFPFYRLSSLSKMKGVHPRVCPLCHFRGRFWAAGEPPRYDAQCPKCGTLERHRLIGMLLQRSPELASGRVIHFAPELELAKILKDRAGLYQSADLLKGRGDLQLDIHDLDLPDNEIGLFVASHILEHVNDRRALSEMYRALRPGGSALILAPVIEGWKTSYENDTVDGERDRDLHFGQYDHVRYYGSDIRDRITEAGFELSEFTATPDEVVKHGLMRGETIFIATKPRSVTQ